MSDGLARLSARQRELVDEWLPGLVVERDHSWGLLPTRVLQIRSGGERFIVKAAPVADHHLVREIRAHRQWLAPLLAVGRAPRLVHVDAEASIIVTECVPGHLVLGAPAADDPDTFRQAGELLRLLHGQESVLDPDHERAENARMLRWLNSEHRIDQAAERELRGLLGSWPTPAATLVPTHGDWQPRNWIDRGGDVVPIDFGRAALRPALTDFVRLQARDFARDPAFEAAFLEGYGSDPREPEAWFRARVREAVAAAAWAFQVGDESFEQEGHAMLARLLSR